MRKAGILRVGSEWVRFEGTTALNNIHDHIKCNVIFWINFSKDFEVIPAFHKQSLPTTTLEPAHLGFCQLLLPQIWRVIPKLASARSNVSCTPLGLAHPSFTFSQNISLPQIPNTAHAVSVLLRRSYPFSRVTASTASPMVSELTSSAAAFNPWLLSRWMATRQVGGDGRSSKTPSSSLDVPITANTAN